MPGVDIKSQLNDKDFQIEGFFGKKQYDDRGCRRYEFIFGETFISAGGPKVNRDFIVKMDLKAGQKVLDVGCGMGGACFQFAREFGLTAYGIDLSSSNIAAGKEYLEKMNDDMKNKVTLEVADVLAKEFPENSFDHIFSRDALMHVHNKDLMYEKFFKWLKPGGKILMTDYCSGSRVDKSEGYKNYLKERNYLMLTLPEYKTILEGKGFVDVVCDDVTDLFIHTLKSEIEHVKKNKEEFLKRFDLSDMDFFIADWTAKINNSENKDQCWGLIKATKPM